MDLFLSTTDKTLPLIAAKMKQVLQVLPFDKN